MAIGTFFSGLIFSRDPASLRSRTAFDTIHELFTPFFFIGIGWRIHMGSLGAALVPAAALVVAAFVGKFAGAMAPALVLRGWKTSILLGLSMIPRAEVAMVIATRALDLQGEAMPESLYTALVLTSLASCLLPPMLLRRLIARWVRPA
jgi:Kef-type K+ transport system membrane component KefB